MSDRQMSIARPQYNSFIVRDLFICSILFLILSLLLNVKNIEINIYFLCSIIVSVILAMNSKMFHWGYMPDHIDIYLNEMSRTIFPCGYYLIYLIVLLNLKQYTILLIIIYFVFLSIIHKVVSRFINNIKAKSSLKFKIKINKK